MTTEQAMATYTRKDFISNQEIRWCPGCGDYSILAAVQKVLPEIITKKENQVFVSGIGCSSRFPYYMNTYGMHSIHGRAPAFATGIKMMNPELDVWVITGDGDSLSIGGNHLIHTLRRNININILLFNNQVYGLTKGQYSPTSKEGSQLKSTPYGSLETPLAPLKLALGAGANFISRSADILGKHMQNVLKRAYFHKGTSLIEILQNCHIFNDKIFSDVLDKNVRSDKLLMLEDNNSMIFGKDRNKCIVFNACQMKLEVCDVKDVNQADILVHDSSNPNPYIHFMLASMSQPEYPVAMGVIRSVESPCYEDRLHQQENNLISELGEGTIESLLYNENTWTVE